MTSRHMFQNSSTGDFIAKDNNILNQQFLSLGDHHSLSRGGGRVWAEVFDADTLFISPRLGGALIMLNLLLVKKEHNYRT